MELSKSTKIRLHHSGRVMLAGVCIALIYPVFADGFSHPEIFIHAFFIGLIGGLLLSLIEQFVFDRSSKRFTFPVLLVTKSILYFLLFGLIIPVFKAISESIYFNRTIEDHINSDAYQLFINQEYYIVLIYTLVFIPIIIFTNQMSKKLGKGVLLSFFTGKYHVPHEVFRIFLFLDISNSTTIAEKLGNLKYHEFLSEFYKDITSGVIEYQGKIYRYVGDQMVIEWNSKKGLQNMNCLHLHFAIKDLLTRYSNKYETKYGFSPAFTSSLHCGHVIVGEIGYVKSQIVYHGQLMYELSTIEKLCSKHQYEMLVSGAVLNQLKSTGPYQAELIPASQEVSMEIYKLSLQ